MKISRLEIVNFGKVSDYKLDLDEGLQIIFGNNEDGKSTIMAFVKLMFYSDHGRSRSLEQMTRQLYTPWNGQPMEGAMEIEYKGANYRVQKLFGDTAGRDLVTLLNLDTGKKIRLKRGEEVGSYFFGLDLSGFKRSSFIKQLGAIDSGKDGDDVSEKLLTNLVSTGSEDISNKEVISRLENAKYKLVSRRGDRGTLAETKVAMEELLGEREQTQLLLESQSGLIEEYDQLKVQLDRLNELETTLNNLRVLEHTQKIKELLELQIQLEEIREKIVTDKHSYDELGDFLEEAQQLVDEYKKELSLLETFDTPVENAINITREEFEALEQINQRHELVKRLLLRYNTSAVHLRDKVKGLEGRYNEITESLSQLTETQRVLAPKKREMEAIREEMTQLEGLIVAESQQYDQGSDMWARERTARLREIEAIGVQLENMNVKSKPNLVLLIIGIVLAVAGVLAGILIIPYFYAALAPAAVLIVLAFINKTVDDSDSQPIREQLQQAVDQLKAWEQDSSTGNIQRKEGLDANRQRLEEISVRHVRLVEDFDFGSYAVLETQLEEYSLNQQRGELELSASKESYVTIIEDIVKELGITGFSVNGNTSLEEVLNQEEWSAKDELEKELAKKSATSFEQYKNLYMTSLANERNEEIKGDIQLKLDKLGTKIIGQLADYGAPADIKESLSVLEELAGNYQKCREVTGQIQLTAKAIGVTDFTIPVLRRVIEKTAEIKPMSGDENIENLKEERDRLKEIKIVGKMEELQKLIRPPERGLEQLSSELEDLREQCNEAQAYYDSISMALEVMKSSQEEMRQNFGPLLNAKTSEIFSRFTGQKYDDLTVSKDYDIRFKEGAHYREWQYLSNGTVDQAYLALRLAISQLISEKGDHMPVLLDDVLIQYDDERASNAIETLADYGDDHGAQLILFTCHGRIVEFAEEAGIPISNIIE